MSFVAILLLAVGLAMDATAVSAARGLAVERVRLRHLLTVAVAFGGFQALMPALGWVLGEQLAALVEVWAHWVAFALLTGLGGKMLWDAARPDAAEEEAPRDLFGLKVILGLAIATSVDAFAAGISLRMLDASLGTSIAVIGLVTAGLSMLGLLAGRRFGALLGRRLDVVGGLVLVALGGKILLQHLGG